MTYSSKSVRFAYTAIFFDSICITSTALVLPLLQKVYGFSYGMTGILLALLSVGNLCGGLLCGLLPVAVGQRNTARILTPGILAGYLITMLTGSSAMLCLAFFLIGIGKGSCMNQTTVVTGSGAADKARSTNLVNALFALGSLLCPFLYLQLYGLSFELAPVAFLMAMGLVTAGFYYSLPLSTDRGKARNDGSTAFLRDRHFWYSVGFLFMQQCLEISVTGWVVTYFKGSGILSGTMSELTVTVIWSAMLLGRLFIAFVLKPGSRLRSLRIMSMCSLVTYGLLLFSKNSYMALIMLFLFGLSECGCYPTGIAQASKSMTNLSLAVMLPIAGIGAIVMPYIVGAVADRAGILAGMACPGAAIFGMLFFAYLTEKKETSQS